MKPTPHQERTRREQQSVDRATERVTDSIAALANLIAIDDAADLVANQLDELLCASLGNAGATRYWLAHLYSTCGVEALRESGGRL